MVVSDAAKRTTAAALFVVALAMGGLGSYQWTQETRQAEYDATVERVGNALDGREVMGAEPDPDRTMPIVLFSLGGLSIVCAAIFVATTDD